MKSAERMKLDTAPALGKEGMSQISGSGGLADATLLIGNGDDAGVGHMVKKIISRLGRMSCRR